MSDSLQNHAPLDAAMIEQLLGERAGLFEDLVVYPSIASTNDWALQCTRCPAVCLAEQQTQGRGRRGRSWVSPQARNIYMSLAWDFRRPLAEMAPLSLVAGIGVARTLQQQGISAQLKWPNDVMVNGRKIAGILIEARSSGPEQTRVAVGVGLNFDMSGLDTRDITQPWTDFASEYAGRDFMDRNRLVAGLLDNLSATFQQFAEAGFAAFHPQWEELDMCRNKPVTLATDAGSVQGEALGVDEQGALRVSIDGRERRFHGGDVSLRVSG